MSLAWQLSQFGLEHLRQVTLPEETPGPSQVVVELSAASLNFRDLLMSKGLYNPNIAMPLIPLSDGVGRVIQAGSRASQKVGERVALCFAPLWKGGCPSKHMLRQTRGGPLAGTLQQRIVVDSDSVVSCPLHLSDVEAATLPCAALTAWSALSYAKLKAGQTVVVQGTGGVSVFALQFAKLWGAHVIATSSSDEKLERVTKMGADAVINYVTDPQWGKTVRSLGGADVIVEVGGAKTLQQSLKAIRPGGTVSLIGILSGGRAKVDLTSVLMNQVQLQGVMVGHTQGFREMNAAISHHKMRPVVDRVFEFDEAPQAFEYFEAARHFGKVCIQLD